MNVNKEERLEKRYSELVEEGKKGFVREIKVLQHEVPHELANFIGVYLKFGVLIEKFKFKLVKAFNFIISY